MPPDILPGDGASFSVPLIVLLCALIQSLAGVGLLLFGTPTLLLLGMGFGETLAVLLPCSATVTLCQLPARLPRNRQAMARIARFTLPMILLGLLFALWGLNTRWMPIVVGVALLGLGILRLSSRATAWLHRIVADYQNTYLAVMGLVHGLSNMGGGLLVVYASTLSHDKEEIRRTIALGYLAFALTQLAMLALHQPQLFRVGFLYLPAISLAAYLVGNRLFLRLSKMQFSRLVTCLILTYGVITVSKALG